MSANPESGTVWAHRIRRCGVAASLMLFPALLVVQAPIDPAAGGTGEVMWRAATDHGSSLQASAVLLMLSGILMVPAAVGLSHLARDRGAALTTVAATLGVLGGFGHFGIGLFYVFALALPGGDEPQMVAFIERLNASPALALVFPLIMAFGLGVLAMAWAAWRTGLAGIWAPVVVTLAVVTHFALPSEIPAVEFAALLIVAIAFGYLGVRIARMSDDAWQAPSVHRAERAVVPVS
jgi:hypothetical protein